MAITKKSVTAGSNATSSATVAVTTSESPTVTAVGDLVVVLWSNDFYTLAAMSSIAATGAPTMNAIATAVADGGSNLGHIKGYWYVANTAGAQTITGTETGTHDEEKSMIAYVLGGADTTTPIDNAANGTGATASTNIAPAVVPTTTTAFVIVQVSSGGGVNTASYTTPGSLTEDGEFHINTAYSGVYASAQLSASGSTGTFTFTPATSINYSAVSIAIKTASGAAVGLPELTMAPRWN